MIRFVLSVAMLFVGFTAVALECQKDWPNGQCELIELIEKPNPYVVVEVQKIECQQYSEGIRCQATVQYADIVGYGETRATVAYCEEAYLYIPGSGEFDSEELSCH